MSAGRVPRRLGQSSNAVPVSQRFDATMMSQQRRCDQRDAERRTRSHRNSASEPMQPRLIYSDRQPPSGDRRHAPRTRSERESPHQADVPAQEALSAQDARFSRAHGDAGRPAGAEGAASQGTQALDSRRTAVSSVQRLRGRSRFAAVRAGGVEGRNSGLRVSLLPNGEDCSRAAIAVVRAPGSVRRNRTRRRLRAAAESLLAAHPGYDVVVHARGDRPEGSFAALVAALGAAVGQAEARART